MRILITGATGFIGKYVTRQLINRGHEVGVMLRNDSNDFPISVNQLILGEAKWTVKKIEGLLEEFNPSAIIHLIGQSKKLCLPELYDVNVLIGVRLLNAVANVCPNARVLFAGSAAEYGIPKHMDGTSKECDLPAPISNYGITKLAQTMHAQSSFNAGQLVGVARIFNPVGPQMSSGLAFSDFASQLIANGNNNKLLVGDIHAKRDFIHVEEASRVLIELIFSDQFLGKVVNVCSGIAQPVSEGLKYMVDYLGVNIKVEKNPSLSLSNVPVIKGCTKFLEKLEIEPPSSNIKRAVEELLEYSKINNSLKNSN